MQLLRANFGHLFEEDLLCSIEECSTLEQVDSDTIIIDIGTYITAMPLLLDGAIKVLREDESGDELILYFLEVGDTCTMTLSCCMQQTKSKIRAITERPSKLLMIPKEKMTQWLSLYPSWQQFVLKSYHNRMEELLTTIDNIAFLKMDQRLLQYLKDKALANQNMTIQTTHQQIANDLYTSRVVISRLLKALEKQHKIKIQRNAIQMLEF